MSNLTVAPFAQVCVECFVKFLSAADTNNWTDRDVVEELFARFNIWADNLGVFASEHASIDYRLRDSPEVRELIVGQLQKIQSHLEQELLSHRKDESNEETRDHDISSSTSTCSSDSEPSTDELTNERPNLQSVKEAIGRLHRLAKAIRRPSVGTHNLKADNYTEYDEFGQDVIEGFRQCAQTYVRFRLPDADETIQERLTEALTLRRRRFLYRRRHQIKLRTRSYTGYSGSLSISPSGLEHVITSSSTDSTPRLVSSPTEIKCPANRAPTILSNTTATDLGNAKFERDVESTIPSTVASSTMSFRHSFSIPPPPKSAKNGLEFECHYCSLILPPQDAHTVRWKQHVWRDLEPYVCLFKDCSTPLRLFKDRSDWTKHMLSHTAVHWRCSAPVHQQETFSSEESYEAHMRSVHGQVISKKQLALLSRRNMRQTPVSFESCPLCGKKTGELIGDMTPSEEGGGNYFSQKDNPGAALEMQKHIARHLQLLSIMSLPWPENGDEIDDSISSGKAESHVTEDSCYTPASALTSSSPVDNDEGEELGPAKENIDDVVDEHEIPPDDSPDATWEFLGSSPSFVDPESDRTLRPFIRRLRFESLRADGKSNYVADLPCRYMPLSRNPIFFGRETVIESLQAILLPGKQPVRPRRARLNNFTLYGRGGVGKTQVAVEFVHSCKDKFDAVFWVQADATQKLERSFTNIALKLGLVVEGSAESRDHVLAKDLVKAWLTNPLTPSTDPNAMNKANWLLVFDHVTDHEILNDFWLDSFTQGSILITSRMRLPWNPAKYPAVEVEPFPSDEAAEFLWRLNKQPVNLSERKYCMEIVQKIGGLPIVLIHFAGQLASKGGSFQKLLQAFKERESERAGRKVRFQEPVEKHESTDGPETEQTIEWTAENLHHSRALLDVVSMLDPDGIPEYLLTEGAPNLKIKGYPTSKESFREACSELLDNQLIWRSRNSGRLGLHRPVQDTARKHMNPQHYRLVFNSCVQLISNSWPYQRFNWRHSRDKWPRCDELYPHIMRLQYLSKYIPFSVDDPLGAYEYSRIITAAAWYCHERGRFLDSEELCNVAHSICEDLNNVASSNDFVSKDEGPTKAQIEGLRAEIYHNRGCILAEMNRPADSLKNLLAFNEMMVRNIGPEAQALDMRLAISWNQLGNAYMINGEYYKGEECFLRSIETMRLLRDFRELDLSLPRVNLGLAYWLTNRYEDAICVLQQGLNARENMFGPGDRVSFITGRFFHALGNVKASQGLLDESYDFHQKALGHYIITLGKGHHRTADTWIKVAHHHTLLKDYKQALSLLDQALDAYSNKEIYRPERARAKFRRATTLKALGRTEEAGKDFAKAYELYKAAAPEDNRSLESLTEADFDAIIAFWSK
ncbi:hypothetical protein BDY21DRAFT_61825 [Lineolata rhizophorae]|uniref:NB-ARC domain-containing protein n=1 Tax=Lineolata rhizophorae TaxID=578093 RepID=A0A6A6NVU3_9PEZI|nr:hypothetical protein BDY21DRAFT_61825 [Lineolata rhizophorae]